MTKNQMVRFERVERFTPWFFLVLIIGLAAFVRWRIDFGGVLMGGVNGPYYPVQVRSLLETGRLGFADFPFVFWLEALVARILFALRVAPLSESIMLASRGTDALFPILSAIPVYLLARSWFADQASRIWPALLTAAFSVLYSSPLIMTNDFQKNAAGAVWLFGFIYFLFRSLRESSWKNYAGAGVFFVLTGLTHIGCLGTAIVFLLVVALGSLLLEPARRRMVLQGVALLFALFVLVIAGLYIFFDPTRVERLLRVFLLPSELFAQPAILALFRGQGLLAGAPDLFNFAVMNFLAIAGAILLVRRWKILEPARRLLSAAAIFLTFLLASPFFLGVQFHPEFKSRPLSPHPIFTAFIRAAAK